MCAEDFMETREPGSTVVADGILTVGANNALSTTAPVSIGQGTATLGTLKRYVPSAVPGIAFLSGGQSDEDATAHLDEMHRLGGGAWPLSFSYGRALQAAALKAWGGRKENVAAGQRAFMHRAKMNSLAALGRWEQKMEKAA